jgi:choline monooxygenase
LSSIRFDIEADISRAWTPPSWVYTRPEVYAAAVERIFRRSWQLVGSADMVRVPGQVQPSTLLEGCLDEPLLLTRDDGDMVHCFSNVCTHRGNLVCEHGGVERGLRCRYHGRRFALDGTFQSMPEFEGVADFPSKADDLRRVPLASWRQWLFVAMDPAWSLHEWLVPVEQRVGWLPLEQFKLDPARSRDYLVQANWALYCENYLEGFHIPFVHAGLSQALDYGQYRTELFRYCSLQVGIGRRGEHVFDLPDASPDRGQSIAAYYFWLFPNQMLNFYPWGLSINIVRPLAVDRTRVSFITYVWDAAKLEHGAGAGLDRVEREDEAVVESVQRGLRSRLYSRGRYSPSREQGTHHFHRLLAEFLA